MFEDKVIIVYSVKDAAGVNISRNMLSLGKWREIKRGGETFFEHGEMILYRVKKDIIYTDYLSKKFNPEFFVFISKHKSESGFKCFTTHTPGNWLGEATHGGKGKSLAVSNPLLQYLFLKNLRNNPFSIEATLEVSHHGPTELKKPVTFIEIGSTKHEWGIEEYGRFVAETVIKSLEEYRKRLNLKVAVGIGGPHYAPKFTKYMEEKDVAIGHIIPKYVLDNLDMGMIKESVEKTSGRINYFLIDWKGVKRKSEILKEISELGYDYIKI